MTGIAAVARTLPDYAVRGGKLFRGLGSAKTTGKRRSIMGVRVRHGLQ
jgi:hypothetical protein